VVNVMREMFPANLLKNQKPFYVIITNIIAPYKTLLFNALQDKGENFRVLYFSESEARRQWKIARDEMRFEFDVMFKGNIDDINPFKLAVATYRKLNFYAPEVVIIGGYDRLACWAALVWTKIRRRKAILVLESHYLDKPRLVIKEFIKKFFISQCNGVLAAGSRHKDYAVKLGAEPERVFIMKGVGGVNLTSYLTAVVKRKNKSDLCDELGIPPKNYFLYVGRFSLEKNLLFLLKIYKRLKDETEESRHWGLILVGDGPQRIELESFIKKNELKDVFLPGFVQQEKLIRFYAVADVFVLPSMSETWGQVVNEAMASGLPVLVSKRCGCYPDLVQEGVNGFGFDPFVEDELFDLMKDIVENKLDLHKMGRASLDIIETYTVDYCAEAYRQAVNAVIE